MNPVRVSLEIDGASSTFRVNELHAEERLHAPWSAVVTAVLEDPDDVGPELDALVGAVARVVWANDAEERTLDGVVVEAARDREAWRLTLAPRVALLARAIDYRVFVDQSPLDVVSAVLAGHGLELDARVTRDLPKRPQRVQPFESCLAFVSRVLAEEGITWYCAGDRPNVVVATDHREGFPAIAEALPVADRGGLVAGRSVYEVRLRRRAVASRATLCDYDLEHPQVDLVSSASDGGGELERYEFPGGFADTALGDRLAAMRLEEHHRDARVLTCAANACVLAAGSRVTLEGNLEAAVGEWLLVRVEHTAVATADRHDVLDYRARFEGVPADRAYRPARAEVPRRQGVETVTTTGAAGQELHTDAHGRVRALLRWDRLRGPRDEHASAWLRTLQPPLSGGFMLPRVGWETLVACAFGDPDAPIVLGRLYQGEAPPPARLPGERTRTAFGTRTTPHGSTDNLLQMDDAAGREKLELVATKDYDERTENDRVTRVVGSERDTVGGDRAVMIGQVCSLRVKGDQAHDVGASRSLAVEADMFVTAASERITIGAARVLEVGGDRRTMCTSLQRTVGAAKVELAIEHHSRTVKGDATETVGATRAVVAGKQVSLKVSGDAGETVGGPKVVVAKRRYHLAVKGSLTESLAVRQVRAGGDRQEGFGGNASYTVGGAARLRGEDVVVTAKEKLTIMAGGVKIVLTPGAVKVQGDFDGSVASLDQGEESYA